jgi:cell division protein FtsL
MTGKRVKASWWVRLSASERKLLMLLGATFLLVFASAIIFLRFQKLKVHETAIADYREAINKVFTEGGSYKERVAKKERREGLISTTPLSFTSHIEQAENLAQVKATDQEEKPPVDEAPGLRKRVISFEMRDVSLDQMLKFISTVESKRGHIVLTEHLEIRNLSGTGPEPEDRLKVDFQMATWERYVSAVEEES